MTDRLQKIFSLIPPCEVFADVGCDHGYISEAMVRSGKCRKVYFSDISQKCLDKATQLLAEDIARGNARGFCCSGLEKVPYSDTVLIAGMGGEEIISILKNSPFRPKTLALQPMKNCDKVRDYLVDGGYKIEHDKIFKSRDKFYDFIIAEEGVDSLTQDERDFGRGNLNFSNADFEEFARQKLAIYQNISTNLKGEDLLALEDLCGRLRRYVKD